LSNPSSAVVEESITNAVKNAQASVTSVQGGLQDCAIELEISDDGVGEPSRAAAQGSSD
jgi:signal transduction histidine kinase